MSTAIATVERDRPGRAMIVADALSQEGEQRKLLGEYVARHMTEGTDYGVIPGTKNKTLLKPGAEKLTQLFRTIPRFTVADKIENWETGLFYYRFTCQVVTQSDDVVVAEGVGSCSTYESRYRWRTADRSCPECGATAILRSKYPPKGRPDEPPGWYCFAKKGGCGANFDHDDAGIVGQQTGRVQNPDLIDCVNTVLKMAKKRALVDAAIALARCSDIFTQDVEDFAEAAAPHDDATPPPAPRPTPAKTPDPAAEGIARQAIVAATTLAELGSIWTALPPAVQARVVADKDRRKAELMNSKPAAPDPKIDVLRVELEDVLLEAGLSFADACRRHGAAALARPCGPKLPSLTDLDAPELLRMIDAVRCGGDPSRQLFDGGDAPTDPAATVRH